MKTPFHNLELRFLKFFLISNLLLPNDLLSESEVIDLRSLLTHIEIADDPYSRRRGLMFRSSLQPNIGMLFIWQDYTNRCMWMKNTKVPLSVAFISKEREILEIYDMVPMSKESTCSKNKAAFALEVNKGWFKEHNISTGQIIDF